MVGGGNGYPKGLSGEDIPLGGRIIAIADAYDTINSDRVYKRARSAEEALAEVERCGGAQFDPDLVKLFVEIMRRSPQPAADTVPENIPVPVADATPAESPSATA